MLGVSGLLGARGETRTHLQVRLVVTLGRPPDMIFLCVLGNRKVGDWLRIVRKSLGVTN